MTWDWDYVALANAFLDDSDVPTIVTPGTPLPVTLPLSLDAYSNLKVVMAQLTDPGNSAFITSTSHPNGGHTPGSPFTGAWFLTTERGIQENITILTAFDGSGNPIADLGFTFTFQGSDDGSNVTVNRAVTLPPFEALRLLHTTDWLSNQWAYYRVIMAPDRALVAGESIVVATRHSLQTGNKFLYPLDYAFIASVQTTPTIQSFSKGIDLSGFSRNIAPQERDPLNSYSAPPSPAPGAGEVYRGTWREWGETHGGCVVTCIADQAGTLYLDRSEADAPANNVDTDVVLPELTFAYEPANGLFRQHFPLQSRWVRDRFVVGTAGLSLFDIDLAFLPNQVQPLQRIGDVPNPNSLGTMGQQIVVAERQEDAAHNVHVKATRNTDTGKDGLNTHLTGVDVAVAFKALPSWQVRQFAVGNLPVQLDITKLANRKSLQVRNHDPTNNVYINSDNGVNSDNGEQISPKQSSGMMLNPTGDVWARTEPTGIVTNYTRFGSTNSGSAASTANALTDDGVFSTISANGQTINIGGFTAGTVNPLIAVKLGLKGRKKSTPTTETVSFQEVKTGTSVTGSVASAALTAGTAQVLLAFISRETTTGVTVTGISGGGLTWTQVATQSSDDSKRILDCWKAVGNNTATAITATFSGAVSSHIAVLRFSNVDQTTPVQASGGTAANASAVTGPVIAGTNLGMAVLGVAIDNATSTAGAGYTERSDETATDGLTTETKPLVVTGNETGTCTLSAGKHYAAIGVTLLPASTFPAGVNLSYTLSAVAGATSGNISLSSTTNADQAPVDITGDRTWVFGDIPNVNVIATGQSIISAAAEVDDLYLLLTDSTGITVRVSLKEIAGTP